MKKIVATWMYYEIIKGEYLFVCIPTGKHYFIKPKNLIGNFSPNCSAYILEKDDEIYAEIQNNKEYKIE